MFNRIKYLAHGLELITLSDACVFICSFLQQDSAGQIATAGTILHATGTCLPECECEY